MTYSQLGFRRIRRLPQVAAMIFLVVLAACSPAPPAAEITPAAAQSRSTSAAGVAAAKAEVPMEDFVRAYIEGTRGGGYRIDANFKLPAIWVFSADGELSQKILADAELSAWPTAFDSGQRPAAASGAMPLSALAKLLDEKFDIAIPADARAQSTALVLLSNRSCDDTCPLYLRAADALAARHPDALRTVVLTLTR